MTTSQGSTESQPYPASGKSKDKNSNNGSSVDQKVKEEKIEAHVDGKVNKYKMKIITSHQIEIEGGSNEEPNVEEIEKEIIDGIRTGKISIN